MAASDRSTSRRIFAVLAIVTLSFGAGFVPAAGATNLPTNGSLQAEWLADGDATDAIGGNHGTLVSGATYTAGASGAVGDQAFAMSGDGGHVTTNDTIGNFGTADTYISFDVRRTGATQGPILSKRTGCNAAAGWLINLQGGGIGAHFYGPGSMADEVNNLVPLADGLWHRVVVSRVGRNLTIVVDGVRKATNNTGPAADVNNTAVLKFGGDPCIPSLAPPLEAHLDNVRIGTTPLDYWPPTITGEILQTPNANGWFATAVTVRWTCSDESGIASCPADSVLTTDGAGQSVVGVAVDVGGNETSATIDGINIDTDGPVITASRNIAPNEAGWNRTDVTVTWACDDDEPGATLDVEAHTFATESATHSETATCTDVAGNTATDTQRAKVDKTAPLTAIDVFVGGDVRGNAADNLSGVAVTTVRWTSLGTVETTAVCNSGCGTTLAKWRATPPQPHPNVYRVAARSVDVAGNVGPSTVAPLPAFFLTR